MTFATTIRRLRCATAPTARVAFAAVVLAGLATSGCDVSKTSRDNLDNLITKGQVSLVRASDSARMDIEARMAEEANASVAIAKDADGSEVLTQNGAEMGGRVVLGDRYGMRQGVGGWQLYDRSTGQLVQTDPANQEAAWLSREEAGNQLETLNTADRAGAPPPPAAVTPN